MSGNQSWWQTQQFVAIAMLASIVPLLWPAMPPLTDLPGHVGRYHVALDLANSPDLQRHWIYRWGLIGNLGVDLAVMPLARLIGLEPAVKLVVMVIPPLFVLGIARLSRAVTGTISPAAAFGFPLAYGFAFQLGFVNFMLAAVLALNALASWVSLGKSGRIGLRTALFIPISCILWLAHSFGWGMFGLLAFAADVLRLRPVLSWPKAILFAGLHCVPLALPMVAMLSGAAGSDHSFDYGWIAKAGWIAEMLRERWRLYDIGCAILLVFLLWTVVRDRRRLTFDPVLGVLALAGFAIFLSLPRLLLGGAYVDMRMLGIAVALALAAIRVTDEHLAPRVALAATAFFALRTITSTIAMVLFAQDQRAAQAAVDHIPRGAAVLVLVNEPCSWQWSSHRLTHIDGLAIARRDAFTNGQWALGGQQLIAPRHPEAEPYRADPSQLVYPGYCEYRTTILSKALRDFDRGTYDYVWTMDYPARPRLAPDVRLVWNNGTSALYVVDPPQRQMR